MAIQRSNVHNLAGGIVTLGAKGQLEVGYLGADPFQFQVQPLKVEELSFAQAHKELQQLEDEIKEAVDVRDMDALNQQAADQVRLTFTIQPEVNDDLDTLLLDVPADVAVKELPSAKGLLRCRIKAELAELQLVFQTPSGVRCSQDTLSFVDVAAGTCHEFKLDFYIAELLHIHSAKVEVIASFVSPRVSPASCRRGISFNNTRFIPGHSTGHSAECQPAAVHVLSSLPAPKGSWYKANLQYHQSPCHPEAGHLF